MQNHVNPAAILPPSQTSTSQTVIPSPIPAAESIQPKEAKNSSHKTESSKKSSNLKLHPDIQKQLQMQADKFGISQAAYVTVLISRNIEGADKVGFEREVKNAKKYMRLR